MSVDTERFCVRSRDVYQLLWEYSRSLQTDLVATIGDTNLLGGLRIDQMYDENGRVTTAGSGPGVIIGESGWFFPVDKLNCNPTTIPIDDNDEEASVVVTSSDWHVMTLKKGAQVLQAGCKMIWQGIKGEFLRMARAKIYGEKQGGYRGEFMALRTEGRGGHYATESLRRLCNLAMKKNRRVGIQRISTRKEVPLGWSKFSFKPCLRLHAGRQALPKSIWIERYKARLKKQRKTDRKSPGKGVTVPKTKYNRPRKVVKIPVGKRGTVQAFGDDYDADDAFQQLSGDVF
jgi:hypothetical protein